MFHSLPVALLWALLAVLLGGLGYRLAAFALSHWIARRAAIISRFRRERCAHEWTETWGGKEYSRVRLLHCEKCKQWKRYKVGRK